MNQHKIIVLGSTNTDMVVQTSKFPAPGETILGGKFLMNPGGKGANQAVAAARLGGSVVFAGKTGNDLFGKQAIESLSKEGINTEHVLTDPEQASGVALITVDSHGENSIVVAPGSNNTLLPENLNSVLTIIDESDIILMQLEIPMQTIEFMARKAKDKNARVILNPAPAAALSNDLILNLDMITPNETEAGMLTGSQVTDVDSAFVAAQKLHDKGMQKVVITLGSNGAVFFDGKSKLHIPGLNVEAVDTTAAGDTFSGALVVAVSNGKPIEDAIDFANKAAAMSVTKMGAQASIPYLNQLTL